MTNNLSTCVEFTPLEPVHFDEVINLGNRIQGDNYLTPENLTDYYHKGLSNGFNACWVAFLNGKMVGFRLTFAPGNWPIDQWCTPDAWPHSPDQLCYFKCNTVDDQAQGMGIGSRLLAKSIETVKQQGGLAGLAHIWLASPGNSAFKYFTKNGGQLVKKHPNKWRHASIYEGYDCPVCEGYCECVAAEMLLPFDNQQ